MEGMRGRFIAQRSLLRDGFATRRSLPCGGVAARQGFQGRKMFHVKHLFVIFVRGDMTAGGGGFGLGGLRRAVAGLGVGVCGERWWAGLGLDGGAFPAGFLGVWRRRKIVRLSNIYS